MRNRGAGAAWLQLDVPVTAGSTYDDLASAAGLEPLGADGWQEIDVPGARQLVTFLLAWDLAYPSVLRPLREAEAVAAEFLGATLVPTTRIGTNLSGLLPDPSDPMLSAIGWNPATDWTFDWGLVLLGPTAGHLYWVAAED